MLMDLYFNRLLRVGFILQLPTQWRNYGPLMRGDIGCLGAPGRNERGISNMRQF